MSETTKAELEEYFKDHLAKAKSAKAALEEISKGELSFPVVKFSKSLVKSLNTSSPDLSAGAIHWILYTWQNRYKSKRHYKYKDGEKCAFRSLKDLSYDAPFLSESGILKAINRLIEAKLLVKGKTVNGRGSYLVPKDVIKKHYGCTVSFLARDAKAYSIVEAVVLNNLRYPEIIRRKGIDARKYEVDSVGNKYWHCQPSIMVKWLPVPEKSLGNALRTLEAANAVIRHDLKSWFFSLVSGENVIPKVTGVVPKVTGCLAESVVKPLSVEALDASTNQVYIKKTANAFDKSNLSANADFSSVESLFTRNQFATLTDSEKANLNAVKVLIPEHDESLATLARLAVEDINKKNGLIEKPLAGLHSPLFATLTGSLNGESQATPAPLDVEDFNIGEWVDKSYARLKAINSKKYLTTYEKLNRLNYDELLELETTLTEIKYNDHDFRTHSEEYNALTNDYSKVKFTSNYDLERISNFLIDTGFNYDTFNFLLQPCCFPDDDNRETEWRYYVKPVEVNKADYNMRDLAERWRYSRDCDAAKWENKEASRIVRKVYTKEKLEPDELLKYDEVVKASRIVSRDASISKTWDYYKFYNLATTPELFWKYLPEIIREKTCIPVFKRGEKVKWVFSYDPRDFLIDVRDIDYLKLTKYVKSDEFKNLPDSGIDVLSVISSMLENRNPDSDLGFIEGEAVEGDPDYCFIS